MSAYWYFIFILFYLAYKKFCLVLKSFWFYSCCFNSKHFVTEVMKNGLSHEQLQLY